MANKGTKKKVNGKVVPIGNLDLFLLAGEGAALNRRASSLVKDTIADKSKLVKDTVEEYNNILGALVYPLNMIEEEIKYMMIAEVLSKRLQDKYGAVQMQVKKSICIEVEPDKCLRLLAGTWAIETTDSTYKPTNPITIEAYADALGYTEYKWALEKILAGESTKDYYKEFMGEFLQACRNEDFILKWELEHILDFGYIPQKLSLKENKLIDYENRIEYNLDVYSTGRRETNDTVLNIRIGANGSDTSLEKKKIKVYNFEVYGKNLDNVNNRIEKIQGAQSKGFASVYDVLLTEGITDDIVTQIKYCGVISQSQIIFEINREIYIAPFDEYNEPKRLVSNVKLYSFEGGRIYMVKREQKAPNVWQENLYSYNIMEEKARLCRISFTTDPKD